MAVEKQDNDQVRSDYQRLYDELQDLKADYEQLSIMFENMGLGYEAHDECQNGYEDGHQHVALRLVEPAVGHEVGSENHGINHEHLLGYCAEHPHGDEDVENLVDGE